VQKLEAIESHAIDLVADGWYTKESLLEQIADAIDND
jgi:hypothetical protein